MGRLSFVDCSFFTSAAQTDVKRILYYTIQIISSAILEKDERAFLNALREFGVQDGTEEFANALRLFREQVGRR